jgi:putative GTP pyrophosphokinase
MQDIGGVRGIVKSIEEVRDLESQYRKGRFTHQLLKVNDYIAKPKPDGYRGIHLIYKYKLDGRSGEAWNGLLIEMQLRTKLQHSWATAVETIDTMFNESLKLGGGKKEWRDFFAIISSAFAHIEESELVPGYEHLSRKETFEAAAKAEASLNVLTRLSGIAEALHTIYEKGTKSWAYHLIILNPSEKKVTISSYPRANMKQASEAYAEAEERANKEKIDSVLVSAGRTSDLRQAYPNYFLDVGDFLTNLKAIINEV